MSRMRPKLPQLLSCLTSCRGAPVSRKRWSQAIKPICPRRPHCFWKRWKKLVGMLQNDAITAEKYGKVAWTYECIACEHTRTRASIFSLVVIAIGKLFEMPPGLKETKIETIETVQRWNVRLNVTLGRFIGTGSLIEWYDIGSDFRSQN